MSNVLQAYTQWAEQYDSNKNRTRDLEALALRSVLSTIQVDQLLEIGCGTGKNTAWLITKANHVTAVDLTRAMLEKAKQRVGNAAVEFVEADINQDWNFTNKKFNAASFSLVLEHIEQLDQVFQKLSSVLLPGAIVYVGELHPFKQYLGTKARFNNAEGTQIVTCYTHHVSDFTSAAEKAGFQLVQLKEWFDEDNNTIPRLLTLLFQYNP